MVKELKAGGDRDEAAEIAALRRPSWVDWALNVAATANTREVERFVEAAELMRDAQRGAVSGRGGVDLRTAMTGLRDRTGELARCVNGVLTGRGRPAALPEITERLAEIATSDRSAGQLRAGLLLGDAGEDIGLGFGDVDDSAPPAQQATKKAPSKQAPSKQVPSKRAAPKQEEATAEPAPDLSLERRRIERDLKTADRVSKAARRDADRADTAVRHAKTAVDAATDALNQAQASLDRAQRRLEREQAHRDAAQTKAETAAAELERLRQALDAL